MRTFILFIVMCFGVNAQADKMNIQGTDYHFVGDSFSEYRSPGDYSTIDEEDLHSYLKLFIRDAIVAGQELGLDPSGNTSIFPVSHARQSRYRIYNVPRNDITFAPDDFYGVTSGIQGGSYRDGARDWVVVISRYEWNRASSIEKRRVVYHELGHALLHKNHSCKRTERWEVSERQVRQISATQTATVVIPVGRYDLAVMGTGACGPVVPWETLNYTCDEELTSLWASDTVRRERCVGGGEFDFNIWQDRLTHLYNNAPSLSNNRYRSITTKRAITPTICRNE